MKMKTYQKKKKENIRIHSVYASLQAVGTDSCILDTRIVSVIYVFTNLF